MSIVYLDGSYLPEEEAKIPVMDRGLLCGDGAYTTIQVCDGRPLFLDLHSARLMHNCLQLHLSPPLIQKEMLEKLIHYNQADKGIWRLKIIITGGQDLAMRLPARSYGHLIMTMNPFTPPQDIPLKLALFPIPVAVCHASFKSLAHLNRYYVMEYAHAQNKDDALTRTEQGIVLEAAFGNLVWIQPEKHLASTPDPQLCLHYGVTISVLEKVLKQKGYAISYEKKTIEEIPSEAYLFRVNTMSGIRSIESVDSMRPFLLNRALELELREWYNAYAGIEKAALKAPLLK